MNKEEAIKYLQQLYPNGGHCWLDEQRIEAIGMAIQALREEPVSSVWHDARKSVPENSISQIICIKEDGLATATEGRIVSGTTKWAYLSDLLNLDNSCNFEKNLQEEPVSDINIEQELYKAFGQVKDFTLGMQIAKRFYEMGKKNQEHVSEDLEDAMQHNAPNNIGIDDLLYWRNGFITGAKWQEDKDKQTLNEEGVVVLPKEEPVCKDLEKVSDKYSEDIESDYSNDMFDRGDIMKAFEAGANWQREKGESTTEVLGDYINELSKQFPEVSFAKLSRIAVRVANWQKEQFEKNRLAHCDAQTEEEAEIEQDFVMGIIECEHRQPTFDDAIKYGMRLKEEQMINDAYEREVKVDAGGYSYIPQMELYDYDKDIPLAKEGDKYKVVLIKED